MSSNVFWCFVVNISVEHLSHTFSLISSEVDV